MVTRERKLRDNPFATLTEDERDELRRVLSWVLAATQTTPEGRATIDKAIDLLTTEHAISPSDIDQN